MHMCGVNTNVQMRYVELVDLRARRPLRPTEQKALLAVLDRLTQQQICAYVVVCVV